MENLFLGEIWLYICPLQRSASEDVGTH